MFTENITELPHAFKEIQNALESPRLYKPEASDVEGNHDRKLLQERYKIQFERIFAPVETESPGLVTHREFTAFFSVLRVFNEDVLSLVGHEGASTFRASIFTVNFIQPPFFCLPSHQFEYQQDTSWGFPIFVEVADPPNTFRKFIPKSYCMVVSSQFKVPFLICEVVSHKHEHNRSRMLIQATALARTGQILLRPASTKKFFVVAIYVDANMVVSRYIVMESGDSNASNDHKPVSIHQKDFDLKENDQQVDFLREMYNLATLIDALSSELASSKQQYLRDIHIATSKVVLLHNEDQAQTTDDTTTHSTTSSA